MVAFLHSSIRVLQLTNTKWTIRLLTCCIPSFVYSGSATSTVLHQKVHLEVAFLHSSIRVLQQSYNARNADSLSSCIPSFVYSGSATFILGRTNAIKKQLHSFIRLFGFCNIGFC